MCLYLTIRKSSQGGNTKEFNVFGKISLNNMVFHETEPDYLKRHIILR